MSKKKKQLSLEIHFEIADRLAIAKHHFQKILELTQELPVSHPIRKELSKLHSYSWFHPLKHRLDADYHELISDDEFSQYGHIYYDSARYDKVVENFAHIKWFKPDEQV